MSGPNLRDYARDKKIEASYNKIGSYSAVGREFGLSCERVRAIIARNKRARDPELQAANRRDKFLRKLEREEATAARRLSRIQARVREVRARTIVANKRVSSRPMSSAALNAKLREIWNNSMVSPP